MKKAAIITLTFATLLTTGLMSGSAAAANCKSVTVTASGASAGAVARFRKRRAKRRAERTWENLVAHHHGNKFSDIDDAKNYRIVFSLNERGNTVATVKGQPCEG